MAQILLDQVDKTYAGGVKAVSELNLHSRDGEFMVLVGPSGCGKSTALRMIAGLEEISSGTIRSARTSSTACRPRTGTSPWCSRTTRLYPHMTVGENMAFGLKMRQMPKDEISRRVAEAAKILGLEHTWTASRPRCRAASASAWRWAGPSSGSPRRSSWTSPCRTWTPNCAWACGRRWPKLHERLRVTTVYVTHDQVEAMTLGDRVCVLRDGLLQQVATPKNLYDRPSTCSSPASSARPR